jgi:hypothetical protein
LHGAQLCARTLVICLRSVARFDRPVGFVVACWFALSVVIVCVS